MADGINGAEETQVLVQFETKLPPEFRVPEVSIAVPTKLKRYGLSQVINHLLALDPPKPFDFIIHGELVRTTLEQHLLNHNISPEVVVKVEYVPVVLPPKSKASSPHNDWVSSLCASPWAGVVSGSYDGSVQLWSETGKCVCAISAAHPRGVNTVACLPESNGKELLLLSGGKDRHVNLWRVGNQGTADVALIARHSGHTQSVTCVAVSPSGQHFCSSGWDGAIHMWQTGHSVVREAEDQDAGAVRGDKKRRTGERGLANGTHGQQTVGPKLVVEESQQQMSGHINTVSALTWPCNDVLYSGGWDHSVRRWDTETGAATDTYNGSKTILSVASAPEAPSLVAFGGSDPVLRVWDVRDKKSEAVQVKSCGSHSGWLTCAAWRPTSQFHLVTGSHDSSIKLWDIRSNVPLATLQQHSDKVLCCAWLSSDSLASGGADCKLQVYELPQCQDS